MNSLALEFRESHAGKWPVPKIGDVCRLINGRAYKKSELLDEGRYRVLRVGNFFTSNHWYFSDLELEDDKYCEDGDLLYAWSASFGPRVWSGERTIYHYHIWKVEPDATKVLRDFLFYFFEWDKDLIRKEQGAGATMTHVSKESMEARAIPLPPLEEQKRIVAVLDQAFAALDRARAHAEANLADAQHVAEVFLDDQIISTIKTFGRTRIDTIAQVKGGKRLPKGEKPRIEKTPYPYITVRDMNDAGTISNDAVGFISATAQSTIKRYTISSSDVYVSIAGTIGKTGVVPEHLDGANLTENAAKLVLSAEWLRDFVYWSTRSSDFRTQIIEQTRTAAQPKLALQRLGAITIPDADRQSQSRIVENMVRFRSVIAALELAYKAKLTDVATLRQSLLQKAFSGELARVSLE